MKRFLTICSIALTLALSACSGTGSRQVSAPSTAGVKAEITEASGSVANAKSASQRSSVSIGKFRTKAELIDYKATRALEFF